MKSSLVLKLMGAFLLVIVIGALVIYFLTTQATQNAFRLYTTQNSQFWAGRLAPDFADFYALTGRLAGGGRADPGQPGKRKRAGLDDRYGHGTRRKPWTGAIQRLWGEFRRFRLDGWDEPAADSGG